MSPFPEKSDREAVLHMIQSRGWQLVSRHLKEEIESGMLAIAKGSEHEKNIGTMQFNAGRFSCLEEIAQIADQCKEESK